MRQPGQEIGACRRDQDCIGRAPQVDMRHVVGDAAIPLVGEHRPSRQGLKSHRRDKMGRRFRQDDLHFDPCLDQQTYDLRGLISRDAASDAEQNSLARGIGHNVFDFTRKP